MRAGKLDKTITIRRTEWHDDGYGNQAEHSFVVATARAQLIEESTDEFMRQWGASTERLRIFRIRFVDGIELSDAVEHDGMRFNIRQIKQIGRRRGLELRCTAIG